MNDEEIVRKMAESAQAFAEPIDFEELMEKGILTKKGRSYYVKDLSLLPKKVRKRLKEVAQNKNGIRVSFHKESKRLKKLAGQLSDYL